MNQPVSSMLMNGDPREFDLLPEAISYLNQQYANGRELILLKNGQGRYATALPKNIGGLVQQGYQPVFIG